MYGPLPQLPGQDPWAYKAYLLPWQAKGFKCWWVLGVFVELLYGSSQQEDVGQVIAHNINRWVGWTEAFLPQQCCIRRGIDKRGRDRVWHRLLLEPSASTTGLLSWLVCVSCLAKDEVPELCLQCLDSFLHHFVGHMDIDLFLPLDPELANAFVHPGSVHHVGIGEEIPIEGAYIWLQPIIDGMEGVTQDLFMRWCSIMDQHGHVTEGK